MRAKALLLLTSLLFISGCGPKIEKWELSSAKTICETHGGVNSIEMVLGFITFIECDDGFQKGPERSQK
jgi:hypothetical protein